MCSLAIECVLLIWGQREEQRARRKRERGTDAEIITDRQNTTQTGRRERERGEMKGQNKRETRAHTHTHTHAHTHAHIQHTEKTFSWKSARSRARRSWGPHKDMWHVNRDLAYLKRHLLVWQKRPTYMEKETYVYDKRDLRIWQKSPTYMAKETCVYGKRDLRIWQKRLAFAIGVLLCCILCYYHIIIWSTWPLSHHHIVYCVTITSSHWAPGVGVPWPSSPRRIWSRRMLSWSDVLDDDIEYHHHLYSYL